MAWSERLRFAGWVVLALGLMCLPIGAGVNPKRDLSLFNNLADLGLFVKMGFVFLLLGTTLHVVASLVGHYE